MDTKERIEKLLDQLDDPTLTKRDLARLEAKIKLLRAAKKK